VFDWRIGEGGVSWANNCDFKDQDLSTAQVRGEKCGKKCIETKGCTHFSWTTFNNGTCRMKWGEVTKNDAIINADREGACGII